MGIAILTSPEIYNFSELLEQPLLKTLENSKFKWVYELLTIFNQGDIATFNNVIDDASNRDVIFVSILEKITVKQEESLAEN
jgi:26S proteasome regulatory subunit N9